MILAWQAALADEAEKCRKLWRAVVVRAIEDYDVSFLDRDNARFRTGCEPA